MATTTDRMLKFKLIIKKPIMINHTFFAIVTFSKINYFSYIDSFVIHHLWDLTLIKFKKDCHQDDLSFACVQFYKYNCLNMLAGNISLPKQVKNKCERL